MHETVGFHRHYPRSTMNKAEDPMQPHEDDALLTPSEVAAMFRVNPKTVTRWARAGKISAIRTLGGHRRFRASEIRQFLEQVEDAERL
jgi:excisionase family DNA binding protein